MNHVDKFKAIVVGWKNVIFRDTETELRAHNRAMICSTCKANKNNICTKCNCPLISLLRQDIKKCKLNKW